jgi:hypothetical protein
VLASARHPAAQANPLIDVVDPDPATQGSPHRR